MVRGRKWWLLIACCLLLPWAARAAEPAADPAAKSAVPASAGAVRPTKRLSLILPAVKRARRIEKRTTSISSCTKLWPTRSIRLNGIT